MSMLNKLRLFLRRYLLLFLLLSITLVSRYLLLKDQVIPFSFDHGKDSLAIMDMWLNRSPKLIGPWTSIPGLFFGPAWYYLLLPFYILFEGNPVGGVWAMVVLVLLQIILSYKYLGRIEAVIITGSAFYMTISTSAWNPFPMALLSLIVLIVLKQLSQNNKLRIAQAFVLGSVAALGFHFSTAFAILYPLLIAASLYYRRLKLKISHFLALGLGFMWPFAPQLLFEIRHDFVESKAILNYLLHGGASEWSMDKAAVVLSSLIQEINHFVLPNFIFESYAWTVFSNIALSILLINILAIWHRRGVLEKKPLRRYLSMPFEYGLWLILPLVAFSFLHFNVWYIYALAPVFVMILSDILRIVPKRWSILLLLCFMAAPLIKANYFIRKERQELMQNAHFLPKQLEIIDHLRTLSRGKPFSVYHYANDVYDFSYQYLYFYQALNGRKLPVEFSYKQDTTDYVVQKADLMAYFVANHPESFYQSQENLNYFYLIEKPLLERLLNEWWTRVPKSEKIILQHPYTKDLTLYYEVFND